MSTEIVEAAPAKINLALAVTGRRADGYHLIDTLAVFAEAGDRVAVSPAGDLSLSVAGQFSGALEGGGANLVARAAAALQQAVRGRGAGFGAAVRLEKNLPVAAGIGGGSADAAATLRALNRLWNLDLAPAALADVGAALGADVPMCLASRPLRARGIGENISPLAAFPPLNLVLVNPGVAVPTATVFSERSGDFTRDLPDPADLDDPDAVVNWLSQTANDLEAPAMRRAPVIGEALSALRASRGCLFARMSGSGATCFAIYGLAGDAGAAADDIARARPDWWVRATTSGGA